MADSEYSVNLKKKPIFNGAIVDLRSLFIIKKKVKITTVKDVH